MVADGDSPLKDGLIKYSSGNTAVVVCSGDAGQVVTVYNDSTTPKVLAMFNNLGVGCVCYKNGKPWLVVTLEGWKVSDRKGNITEKGKFPRQGQEIQCEPTEHVFVTFKDRQHITLTYDNDGTRHTWDCGEHLKRSESHLDKVVGCSPDGKLSLDVEAIRARQARVGSVYTARGPHAQPTQHTGLGSLKTALKTIRPGGELQAAVQQLQATDARVQLINTLPCPLYGTARDASAASISGQTTEIASSGLQSTSDLASTQRSTSSPLLPDYGCPPMSRRQRRWQKAGEASGKPAEWQSLRRKLESISMASMQTSVTGKDAIRDMLYCVCLLADWQPGCARLLPRLELGWGTIQADAIAQPAGPSGRIKVLKVDASEGNTLQHKYSFRSVPMFLMFYEGRLVYADNNISTPGELAAACTGALEHGRKGQFLPDSFSFGGRDNNLLNHITPFMSLRA